MSFLFGFIYITSISLILFCGYVGGKSIYLKIKKDGFVKFLESSFYLFVAVAIVYLLSIRVSNSIFPEPQFQDVHGVKYERTNNI